MMDVLMILVCCVIGFIWTLLLHAAVEWGRREGIVAKKDRDEYEDASRSETME